VMVLFRLGSGISSGWAAAFHFLGQQHFIF
jgi:hypothetical protein